MNKIADKQRICIRENASVAQENIESPIFELPKVQIKIMQQINCNGIAEQTYHNSTIV